MWKLDSACLWSVMGIVYGGFLHLILELFFLLMKALKQTIECLIYSAKSGKKSTDSDEMGVTTLIKDYGTEILNSIRENDLKTFQAIVEKTLKTDKKIQKLCLADIKHKPTKKFACPLILAARQEDCTMIKYMLEKGCDPNFVHHTVFSSKRRETVTALHIAVDLGYYDTVETLLYYNADPNIGDHNAETPLHIGVKKADRVLSRMLLNRGADPQIPDRKGNGALHIATKWGHLDIVRCLLKHSADPYQKGEMEAIPPHIAAQEGHVHLVQLFCSRDVGNVNVRLPCFEDRRERTPLHLAVENGHVETAAVLLDQFKADVTVKDSDHNTPLHCVVLRPFNPARMREKEYFTETARILLKFRVAINEKNAWGDTALHLAAMNGFQRIVELLLAVGANSAVTNDQNLRPIDLVPDSDPVTKQVLKAAMLNPRRAVDISNLTLNKSRDSGEPTFVARRPEQQHRDSVSTTRSDDTISVFEPPLQQHPQQLSQNSDVIKAVSTLPKEDLARKPEVELNKDTSSSDHVTTLTSKGVQMRVKDTRPQQHPQRHVNEQSLREEQRKHVQAKGDEMPGSKAHKKAQQQKQHLLKDPNLYDADGNPRYSTLSNQSITSDFSTAPINRNLTDELIMQKMAELREKHSMQAYDAVSISTLASEPSVIDDSEMGPEPVRKKGKKSQDKPKKNQRPNDEDEIPSKPKPVSHLDEDEILPETESRKISKSRKPVAMETDEESNLTTAVATETSRRTSELSQRDIERMLKSPTMTPQQRQTMEMIQTLAAQEGMKVVANPDNPNMIQVTYAGGPITINVETEDSGRGFSMEQRLVTIEQKEDRSDAQTTKTKPRPMAAPRMRSYDTMSETTEQTEDSEDPFTTDVESRDLENEIKVYKRESAYFHGDMSLSMNSLDSPGGSSIISASQPEQVRNAIHTAVQDQFGSERSMRMRAFTPDSRSGSAHPTPRARGGSRTPDAPSPRPRASMRGGTPDSLRDAPSPAPRSRTQLLREDDDLAQLQRQVREDDDARVGAHSRRRRAEADEDYLPVQRAPVEPVPLIEPQYSRKGRGRIIEEEEAPPPFEMAPQYAKRGTGRRLVLDEFNNMVDKDEEQLESEKKSPHLPQNFKEALAMARARENAKNEEEEEEIEMNNENQHHPNDTERDGTATNPVARPQAVPREGTKPKATDFEDQNVYEELEDLVTHTAIDVEPGESSSESQTSVIRVSDLDTEPKVIRKIIQNPPLPVKADTTSGGAPTTDYDDRIYENLPARPQRHDSTFNSTQSPLPVDSAAGSDVTTSFNRQDTVLDMRQHVSSEDLLRAPVLSPVQVRGARSDGNLARSRTPDSIFSDTSSRSGGLRLRVSGNAPKAYSRSEKASARTAFIKAPPVEIFSSEDEHSRLSEYDDDGSVLSLPRSHTFGGQKPADPLPVTVPETTEPKPEETESKMAPKLTLLPAVPKPYKSFGVIDTKVDALMEAMAENNLYLERLEDFDDIEQNIDEENKMAAEKTLIEETVEKLPEEEVAEDNIKMADQAMAAAEQPDVPALARSTPVDHEVDRKRKSKPGTPSALANVLQQAKGKKKKPRPGLSSQYSNQSHDTSMASQEDILNDDEMLNASKEDGVKETVDKADNLAVVNTDNSQRPQEHHYENLPIRKPQLETNVDDIPTDGVENAATELATMEDISDAFKLDEMGDSPGARRRNIQPIMARVVKEVAPQRRGFWDDLDDDEEEDETEKVKPLTQDELVQRENEKNKLNSANIAPAIVEIPAAKNAKYSPVYKQEPAPNMDNTIDRPQSNYTAPQRPIPHYNHQETQGFEPQLQATPRDSKSKMAPAQPPQHVVKPLPVQQRSQDGGGKEAMAPMFEDVAMAAILAQQTPSKPQSTLKSQLEEYMSSQEALDYRSSEEDSEVAQISEAARDRRERRAAQEAAARAQAAQRRAQMEDKLRRSGSIETNLDDVISAEPEAGLVVLPHVTAKTGSGVPKRRDDVTKDADRGAFTVTRHGPDRRSYEAESNTVVAMQPAEGVTIRVNPSPPVKRKEAPPGGEFKRHGSSRSKKRAPPRGGQDGGQDGGIEQTVMGGSDVTRNDTVREKERPFAAIAIRKPEVDDRMQFSGAVEDEQRKLHEEMTRQMDPVKPDSNFQDAAMTAMLQQQQENTARIKGRRQQAAEAQAAQQTVPPKHVYANLPPAKPETQKPDRVPATMSSPEVIDLANVDNPETIAKLWKTDKRSQQDEMQAMLMSLNESAIQRDKDAHKGKKAKRGTARKAASNPVMEDLQVADIIGSTVSAETPLAAPSRKQQSPNQVVRPQPVYGAQTTSRQPAEREIEPREGVTFEVRRPESQRKGSRRADNRTSGLSIGSGMESDVFEDPPKETSLQDAAFQKLSQDLQSQQKLKPVKQMEIDKNRPIIYTRGVYQPRNMHFASSTGGGGANSQGGRYDDSELVGRLWAERNRPAGESEGEADTEEMIDRLEDEAAREHFEREEALKRLDAEVKRLEDLPASGAADSAFQPVSPGQVSRSSSKRVTIIDSEPEMQRTPSQQKSRRKKGKKDRPINMDVTPSDFSDYGRTAQLWMEQVDTNTWKKSKTMKIAVMDKPPSEELRLRLPSSVREDPYLTEQWVIARGRCLRRRSRSPHNSKYISDSELDIRPTSPGRQALIFFRVGANWVSLAAILFEGVQSEAETVRMVRDIQIKHPKMLSEMVNDMMKRWWRKKGKAATVEELQRALDMCGMPYIQEEYIEAQRRSALLSYTDTEDDLDVSEISDTDPDVSRLIGEYEIRSRNASFEVDPSFEGGLDYNQSMDNMLKKLNAKGLVRTTSGRLGSRDSLSRRSYTRDPNISVDSLLLDDNRSQHQFVIKQPQLKSREYRLESNV